MAVDRTMTTDTACGTARAGRVLPDVHRIEFDVPWPPKHAAAYLLSGPETVLIDAGTPGADGRSELRAGLAEVDAELADVDHVLVTHAHTDHVGQLPALREAGATVHVPTGAIPRLERDLEAVRNRIREAAIGVGYRGDDLREVVAEGIDSVRQKRRLIDPETARRIDPNGTFSVGGREFGGVETPGHEVHHLCFETTVAETPVLFAGDALIEPFRSGAFQVGIDRGAYEAVDEYYRAMDRLAETTATVAFPGHGPAFCDPRRVVRTTRERLDRLLAETREATAAIEPATPLSITEHRAGEVRYVAPLLDTLGALGALEKRGRLSHDTDDGVRYYETTQVTDD